MVIAHRSPLRSINFLPPNAPWVVIARSDLARSALARACLRDADGVAGSGLGRARQIGPFLVLAGPQKPDLWDFESILVINTIVLYSILCVGGIACRQAQGHNHPARWKCGEAPIFVGKASLDSFPPAPHGQKSKSVQVSKRFARYFPSDACVRNM